MRILIVEDDRDTRQALVDLLESEGFLVDEVENSRAALTTIAGQQPDLVLSDIQMPGMDGIELAQRLRLAQPGLPVVLMTASEYFLSAAQKAGLLACNKRELPDDATLEKLRRLCAGTRQTITTP